jgi:cell division protein FtsZ
MTINLKAPELRELKPRILVCGVGGGGGNAVNNMIMSGLSGVDFLIANTDAQALASSRAERIIQMGLQVTEGLGAGAQPEVGRAAAEEAREEIREHLSGSHMVFVTAGMGGGTGTGAAPVIAAIAREMGILTVGVVTKPFHFEGTRRLRIAETGISELQKSVDTLIIIPNQNLFRIATEKTTFADAFAMADQVLYSGVASVTDLMVKEGLINLDFADVRSIMRGMGKAMMGTGEATGERRASLAAEAAIANPLLDEVSMKGARGLLISITGGNDLTLYEVDEAASRIRQEVDEDANIILGATFDSSLEGVIRVSVVATGIDLPSASMEDAAAAEARLAEAAERLRAQVAASSRQQQAAVAAAQQIVETAPQPVQQAYAPEPRQPAPAPERPAPSYYAEQAPAPVSSNGVYIEPVQSTRPTYAAQEPVYEQARQPSPELDGPYYPPAAELPRTRMPQIEDFPRPVQDQYRQARGDYPPPASNLAGPDTRRRTLLERLASFGASRQEEALQQAPAAPRPPQRPQAPQPTQSHAEYAKRPAAAPPAATHAGLDPHGRRGPAPARSVEDEQLEIPAFLRRQVNS